MKPPVSVNVEGNFTNVLNELYRDLAKPSFQAIGKTLGTAFELGNTVLFPLKILNERVRMILLKNLEDYRKRLEDIPEEELCDVNPSLAIPILDKFTYITDNDLRKLYINLLFSASWSKTEHLAHPSSVKIIESLSPNEAKILTHVKDKDHIPFIRFNIKRDTSEESTLTEYKYVTKIEQEIELAYPDNMGLYMDNLQACGLYFYNDRNVLRNDAVFNNIKEGYIDLINALEHEISTKHPGWSLKLKNKIIMQTDLGIRFIQTCCT